jgi:hypothetical protein
LYESDKAGKNMVKHFSFLINTTLLHREVQMLVEQRRGGRGNKMR